MPPEFHVIQRCQLVPFHRQVHQVEVGRKQVTWQRCDAVVVEVHHVDVFHVLYFMSRVQKMKNNV